MLSHISGPMVAYGDVPTPPFDENPTRGSSLFDQGVGLINPRTGYFPGQNSATPIYGWSDGGGYVVLDAVPSVAAATNIAAAQTPAAAGPLTLVTVTGAGVTAGASVTNAATGAIVTGLLALDGAPGTLSASGAIALYDPAKALSRCVIATSSNAADDGATLTVAGYDLYGAPMTDVLTLSHATPPVSKKAFKFVASATISAGTTGTVSLGTADVFGLPLAASKLIPYVTLAWNGAAVTAATGFTAADATTPAIGLTGDVRGTYAVQSPSDGTKSLQAIMTIPPAAIAAGAVGILGVVQA